MKDRSSAYDLSKKIKVQASITREEYAALLKRVSRLERNLAALSLRGTE